MKPNPPLARTLSQDYILAGPDPERNPDALSTLLFFLHVNIVIKTRIAKVTPSIKLNTGRRYSLHTRNEREQGIDRFSSPVSRNLTVPGGEGNVAQRGIARAIADCRATTALNPESIVHSNVHDQVPRG
ncbi:hypothetical protein GX48_07346 [Paracoccidioides brasiliensis]|nr:hypothetical protein GX48_07346 [Paracoccidioides brasiliensis]